VTHGRTLAGDAQQWATPTSRDWKDGADPSPLAATSSLLGRQAPRITKDGLLSLLPADWICSRLSLNPRFVEWLMGWPLNLTAPTGSELVEMESWRSKQRMRLLYLMRRFEAAETMIDD
jgi:hypothetical protein